MLQDSTNSSIAFSASCWLWKCFPCKKLSRCLRKWQSVGKRSDEYGGRGKTWWPNSFNFWSFGCVTWGQVLSLQPNASCRCWDFQSILLIYWVYFSDVVVSPGFRKLSWIRQAADHQTVTMTVFWWKFGFGKCFGAAAWTTHWGGCHWLLYTIHFLLHTTIWLRNGSLLWSKRR